VSASLLSFPRVGFIIPRHGRTAVERNRLKRRLREIVRTRLLPELPPLDLVIRTRPSAYAASVALLADDLRAVARQLRELPRLGHPGTLGAAPPRGGVS
jgi:ribonuclease P protein component